MCTQLKQFFFALSPNLNSNDIQTTTEHELKLKCLIARQWITTSALTLKKIHWVLVLIQFNCLLSPSLFKALWYRPWYLLGALFLQCKLRYYLYFLKANSKILLIILGEWEKGGKGFFPVCVYVYICMCVCVCVCMYMHIYTYVKIKTKCRTVFTVLKNNHW